MFYRGPFITALGQIWCPEHFICVNPQCRRALQDIGFVEEKGCLYCEYCFELFIAPPCSKCNIKIKGVSVLNSLCFDCNKINYKFLVIGLLERYWKALPPRVLQLLLLWKAVWKQPILLRGWTTLL